MHIIYNPKAVAIILGSLISLVTTMFLGLLDSVDNVEMLMAAIISFSASSLLIYLILEFLFFQEIYKIYKVVDKLKKKDFKKVRKDLVNSENPMKALRHEIFTFSKRQENEVNKHLKAIQQKEEHIDKLQLLQAFRREFLADISHELKTPIFSAQGFIHTLLDGAVEDKTVRMRFLQNAANSLEGLESLVNDLLTLSKMETGALKMQLIDFDLPQLIKEVAEQFEIKLEAKHVSFNFKNKIPRKLLVRGDRQRIRQVFNNLVTNAIKYGNEFGKVEITLEESEDKVNIIVSDNGPGIADEHLNRIFERLYRVEKSRNKDSGGSGLGLAIVKQIINLHGAEIKVESTVDVGTTFRFSLEKGGYNKIDIQNQVERKDSSVDTTEEKTH